MEEGQTLFDEYYYLHGCGDIPYGRSPEWLNLFDRIAGRIIADIHPQSVLDAGCALGFLVESLRKREVQAFGVDISEYAIAQVHESVKAYCWQGSIVEPFPRRYDLIVTIEVLEHLPKADGERAVENLCRYTDDILFSSSPFDYEEPTHFNVQPPEYWAGLFARHGFYRDVDFDASFITPWAVRFRRRREPTHRLIAEYERKFWLLWQENQARRKVVAGLREDLAAKERRIAELQSAVDDARRQAASLEAEQQALRSRLNAYRHPVRALARALRRLWPRRR